MSHQVREVKEGNCMSGVALVMRHRLSGIPTYGLNGLRKRDENPAFAAVEYYGIFTFILPSQKPTIVAEFDAPDPQLC